MVKWLKFSLKKENKKRRNHQKIAVNKGKCVGPMFASIPNFRQMAEEIVNKSIIFEFVYEKTPEKMFLGFFLCVIFWY